MLVKLTYVLVIFIWATTPLAIKYGGDSLEPIVALTLRMAIALSVGSLICTLFGLVGLKMRRHWPLYFAASISLFPNMLLVYMAAQTLPSGMVALLFGLSPFFTAVLAGPILGESLLNLRKLLAIVIAMIGLLCILSDDVAITGEAYIGIGLMLVSNTLFSGSALWVKKLNARLSVEPLEQALGAMAFSLPGLAVSWVLLDAGTAIVVSRVSLLSLLYLSLFASLVGFVAYYFILKKMSVETVALIPFISPVLALLISVNIAGETISLAMYFGAGCILFGLAMYQGFWRAPRCRVATNTAAIEPGVPAAISADVELR